MKFSKDKYSEYYKLKNKIFIYDKKEYEIVGLVNDNRSSHYILKKLSDKYGYNYEIIENSASNCGCEIIDFDKQDEALYIFYECCKFTKNFKKKS